MSSSGSKFKAFLSVNGFDHSAGVCGNKGGESQQVEEGGLEHLNKSEGSSVAENGFVGKNYFTFFHASDGDFGREILLDPGEVFIGHVWEDGPEVVFMFFGELEGFDELLDGFESGKNGVVSIEGVLSEEDLEGSLFFMFVLEEVGVGAGELVEVIVEEVDFSDD